MVVGRLMLFFQPLLGRVWILSNWEWLCEVCGCIEIMGDDVGEVDRVELLSDTLLNAVRRSARLWRLSRRHDRS